MVNCAALLIRAMLFAPNTSPRIMTDGNVACCTLIDEKNLLGCAGPTAGKDESPGAVSGWSAHVAVFHFGPGLPES